MQRIVTPADLEVFEEDSAYDFLKSQTLYVIRAYYREDRNFAAQYVWADQPFEEKRAEALEKIAAKITEDLACREQ